MTWRRSAIGALLLCRASLGAQAQSPFNPHASPEARALLSYLYSISGNSILTGQHLRQLQDTGAPVLWRPYPQANSSKFWWAATWWSRGLMPSVVRSPGLLP